MEIELDQVAGTAKIVWEFRPEPDIHAPFVSSARRLENGNTVVGFGIGEIAVFEVTPQNRMLWRLVVEERIYRFTPITEIAGEQEVSASGEAVN